MDESSNWQSKIRNSLAQGREAESKITSVNQINDLIQRFENGTLPRCDWTHHAHLIVALWYLIHYSQDKAIHYIRNGIQRYNQAIGIKTTKDSGYHETLTLFWVKIVHYYLATKGTDCSMVDLANGLIECCGNPNLPLDYYSSDRLMSWEARLNWVEPDLELSGLDPRLL